MNTASVTNRSRTKYLPVLLLLLLSFLLPSALAQGERPAWHALELTDALTGETFTLSDFDGRTVFVETMATWCSRCNRQLTNVKTARAGLSDDEVVFVALSVEGNLPAERLAAYAERNGFDWTFAVATPEMLTALVDAFGRTIANPPSTPHFLIGPDGATSALSTGIDRPEEIVAQVQAAPAP